MTVERGRTSFEDPFQTRSEPNPHCYEPQGVAAWVWWWLPPLVVGGLILGPALNPSQQFGFRDAAHFYYPLHELIQREWSAGRVPLWEPEENGGMPLLGNPTAAVLYPLKLIFFAAPFPLASKLYAMIHVLGAYLTLFALARSLGISHPSAAVGALSYAFGAPVLFQIFNIVFLVGAAWLPLGILGIDLWVRRGRRWGLVILSWALAMQTLGGDPQTSYLTGLCGVAYTLALRRAERRSQRHATTNPNAQPRQWIRTLLNGLILLLGVGVWIGATLGLAAWLPPRRPVPLKPELPEPLLPAEFRYVLPAVWIVIALGVLFSWRRLSQPHVTRRRIVGLAFAGATAALLTSAQLLPVLEFSRLTVRAARVGPHDVYPFSLPPYQLLETIWPQVLGRSYAQAHAPILDLTPPASKKIWNHSYYLGAAVVALALGGFAWKRGEVWRVGLSWMALIATLAALGEYAGPLFWARLTPWGQATYGPRDPDPTPPIRLDGQLRDGDGSLYWGLSQALPGFSSFRYPAKLFGLTCLAVSVLAASTLDRLGLARRADQLTPALRAWILLVGLTGLTWTLWLVALIKAPTLHELFQSWIDKAGRPPAFNADASVADLQRGLLHAAVVLALTLAVLAIARRQLIPSRIRYAHVVALVVLVGLDLTLANRHLILLVDQAIFDRTPEVLEIIQRAESQEPSEGPYRIHRVPLWHPPALAEVVDQRDVLKAMTRWEHDTLQPKYGIPRGVEYTQTLGTMELFDHSFFMAGFYRTLDPPSPRKPGYVEFLQRFGLAPGDRVVYAPRRSFDLWNTRYFVLPAIPKWDDEHRGILTFLDNARRIYPPPDQTPEQFQTWAKQSDYQIYRNLSALPRVWAVREPRVIARVIDDLDRESRTVVMEEMMFRDDYAWSSTSRTVFDPLRTAWVEHRDGPEILSALASGPSDPEIAHDVCRIVERDSQRVVIETELTRPALVVLSEVDYPGWTARLDDQPITHYRVNRLMRGAVVPSGRHRLEYRYQPDSFRWGLVLSGFGMIALGSLSLWSWRDVRNRRATPTVTPHVASANPSARPTS